jgi:putative peptide zinc metalloprotease protein
MEKFRATLHDRGTFMISLLKRGAIPYVLAIVVLVAGVSGVAAATGTLSGTTGSEAPTASAAAAASTSGQLPGYPAAGGGDNIVQVLNHTDALFRMDGKAKLTQSLGPNVGPKNEAFAYSSCSNCQTLAVALEINLYSPDSHNVQPFNDAMAVNYRCTNCVTAAIAYQYAVPVADPKQVRTDVFDLVRDMDSTLNQIKSSHEPLGQAIADVDGVVAQFTALGSYLTEKRAMATDPTTPGASPMTSPPTSPSDSSSPAATVSGAPTESPTASPQPSPSTSP